MKAGLKSRRKKRDRDSRRRRKEREGGVPRLIKRGEEEDGGWVKCTGKKTA